MKEAESQEGQHAGGGTYGLRGYEYQVDVSVWTALDLVLAKSMADAVVLEPCSQEDLEAELHPSDPGVAATDVPAGERTLVIQAKSRGNDPWDWRALLRLLKHGGERRVSAKDRLKDSKIHYLLVTDAALTGVATGLRTRSLGYWPRATGMPASVGKELHDRSAGRVAVLDSRDETRIGLEIKELLTGAFRVPQLKWEACLKELRDEARMRMTGTMPNRWSRAQLEAVIKRFDGYFASSPMLASFVQPLNWASMCEQLMSKHAVVIIGASGTGKTLTSEALWDFASKKIAGLTRVHVRDGPSGIRTTHPNVPVLFDIEDPWGRYRFEPDSEEWNDRLPDYLRTARADRLFVVTSRSDVVHDATATSLVKQWRIPLEAEHYGDKERSAIYNDRMRELRSDLRSLALTNRKAVLKDLETPLEIQKFFDALATDDDESGGTRERITRAVRDAHRDSIYRIVAQQVKERRSVHWGVVIWGMLKAVPKLSRAKMPELQDKLYEQDQMYESGFEELVNFFVAGRNLRQQQTAVSYYHPKVEQGLEAVVVGNRRLSCRVLGHVAQALISIDDETTRSWGREACANLVAAANKVQGLHFRCPGKTQDAVDEWLNEILLCPEIDFERHLRLASSAGSPNCIPAEIARFLLNRNGSRGMFYTWAPPTDNPEWFDRVAAYADTKAICERFVRTCLPHGLVGDYPESLVTHLIRMAGDLSTAFIDAAMSIVEHGYNSNDDCIVAGALSDMEAFEQVVATALAYWNKANSNSNWRDTSLRIRNGEYSEDYAEHLSESAGEEGFSADVLLEAFVARFRQTKGWDALVSRPDVSALLRWWLRAVGKDNPKPPVAPAEIVAVGHLALNSNEEGRLWSVLYGKWHPDFEEPLVARLVDGHADTDVRQSAASCLAQHLPGRLPGLVQLLLGKGSVARLVGLFEDLAEVSGKGEKIERAAFIVKSIEHVPPPYREFVMPFATPEDARSWKLNPEAITVAKAIAPKSEADRFVRLRFGTANALPVEEDARYLLESTEDEDVALTAFDSAAKAGLHELVEAGLKHRFAKVRAQALRTIVSSADGEIAAGLLNMADDKGKYVREALAQLIAVKPGKEHLEALLKLAADRWTRWSMHHESAMHFPIARTAAQTLLNLPNIPGELVQALLKLASETEDGEVRLALMRALARSGPKDAREALIRLVLAPGRSALRTAAAWALISESDSLEEDVIGLIDTISLCRVPVAVAALLAILVGAKAPYAVVKAASAHLAESSARKPLLLLLAIAYPVDSMRSSLLEALPTDHPGRALVLQPDVLQSREALNDLGDAESVNEVLNLLSKRFQTPPQRRSMPSSRS